MNILGVSVFVLGPLLLLYTNVWILDAADDIEATVSTKNVTAHYCPFPCTVGNQTLCYPPPCPPPACVDPARYKPTDCCVYCPHGDNCRGPGDSIIDWNHWKIINGKNCTCNHPGNDAVCV
ncbi:hypothetical protein ACF0H5_023302 [Mactra antiquata]